MAVRLHPEYLRLTRFFGTLLVINVAIGVVTGLVQEFESGMRALDQVDEIVVLDGGLPVERGSHAQLLSTSGWYARMWREQIPAYSPGCAASLPDFTAAENAL